MMSKQSSLKILVLIAISTASNSHADDYFLTMSQKQELVVRGQLHDEQQRLYDIWIVPGYAVPLRHIKQGWQSAGESLADYSKPRLYSDMKKYSNNTWRYGSKDILKKYTFKGTNQAWASGMQTASRRTQQRVFGWWLAYPWGIFEATTESALRLVTGVPVGVAVSASAYSVVPAITMVWPLVESVGYAAIEGTAYPVIASAWNTAVAPPLAVLGQQPAPQRADGFWMKQVDDPNLQALADALNAWQHNLPVNKTKAEISPILRSKQEQLSQLHQQIKILEQEVQSEEKQQQQQRVIQLLAQAQQQKPLLEADLQAKGLSLAMLARNRQAIKVKMSYLDLSFEDLDKLLDVLLSEKAVNTFERNSNEKTDPLQRSLDILQQH